MPPDSTRPPRRILTFGRRQGRRLREGKVALLEGVLPAVRIGLNTPGLPQAWFSGASAQHRAPQHLALELGFGYGEFLANLAEQRPDWGLIGCEVYWHGVSGLLAEITARGIPNIRIYPDDGRTLVAALPDACLDAAYILFPDPWPKSRHHKRRLINPALLAQLARVLTPGARLVLATDHPEYACWMLEHVLSVPHWFRWQAASKRDWQTPPPEWTLTRYQQKNLAETERPVFLVCERC